MRPGRSSRLAWLVIVAVLATGAAVGASALSTNDTFVPSHDLAVRSRAFAMRYFVENPDAGPVGLRDALHRIRTGALRPASVTAAPQPAVTSPVAAHVFNRDATGLPQNEESGSACPTDPNFVLQGMNDYRGLLSQSQDLTGFAFSDDGGATVKQDGQLPSVTIGSTTVPSSGDPVDRWSQNCTAFASDIDFTANFFGLTSESAVVVRSSSSGNLDVCSSPQSCWPKAKVVDSTTSDSVFLDKDWMDVGRSGTAEVVWVTYTRFVGENAYIEAVRCNLALTSCTAPIQVSDNTDTGFGAFVQGSYVVIGPDGRVYVTYETFAQTGAMKAIKLKIAPAGSTAFAAAKVVAKPAGGIPPNGRLAADDFRVGTLAKAAVAMVGATPRVFVADEECTVTGNGLCEGSQVKVRYSDDSGASWSTMTFGPGSTQNYFPTVAVDATATPNKVVLSWYTNGNDTFAHRDDVELASFPADLSATPALTRVTPASNEPDADPLLGGAFIGDYFEVTATGGNAYVSFNENRRKQQFVGDGVPVFQQDNYLAIVPD